MTKQDIAKILLALAIGGAGGGATVTAVNQRHCDYTLKVGEQDVCVTQAQVDAVKASTNKPEWESSASWNDLEK